MQKNAKSRKNKKIPGIIGLSVSFNYSIKRSLFSSLFICNQTSRHNIRPNVSRPEDELNGESAVGRLPRLYVWWRRQWLWRVEASARRLITIRVRGNCFTIFFCLVDTRTELVKRWSEIWLPYSLYVVVTKCYVYSVDVKRLLSPRPHVKSTSCTQTWTLALFHAVCLLYIEIV